MISTWQEFIENESKQKYYKELIKTIKHARENTSVFPSELEMFSCFELCPLESVKVVVIGQDPYHGAGQAHGLSFSVKDGVKIPPSLRNIYKELQNDIGVDIPKSGDLSSWSKQGVLLMNTSFSVEEGEPASHSKIGWMTFSEHILDFLNDFERPLVFILWGAHAQKVGARITNPKHLKIASAHPSPFSAHRGFFGSKPFSKTNDFLRKTSQTPISWKIDD